MVMELILVKKSIMKSWIKIISTIIIVLVIDLVTKHFLFDVEYFNLIPNLISIATNGGNDGAAFRPPPR